jgi:hypothetical protein
VVFLFIFPEIGRASKNLASRWLVDGFDDLQAKQWGPKRKNLTFGTWPVGKREILTFAF